MAKPYGSIIRSGFGRAVIAVITAVATSLAFANSAVALQAPIDLGTTANYVVLAGTGITNTGPTTASGDAGADFGSAPTGTFTGDTSVTTTGTKFTSVVAQTTLAKTDLVDAYDDAAGRTPFTVVSNLTGNTYTTGVYHSDSTISLDSGGTVTLDAENDPDAVFIFQAGSSLITGSASVVALVNGAQACNVYWQVGSDATFGTTTDFSGHVFALTSIVAQTGATFDGQLLARNGTVTLDTNTFVNDGCADTGGSGGGGGGGTDEGLASTGVDDWTLPIVVGLSASLIVVAVFVVRHRRRIGRHSA